MCCCSAQPVFLLWQPEQAWTLPAASDHTRLQESLLRSEPLLASIAHCLRSSPSPLARPSLPTVVLYLGLRFHHVSPQPVHRPVSYTCPPEITKHPFPGLHTFTGLFPPLAGTFLLQVLPALSAIPHSPKPSPSCQVSPSPSTAFLHSFGAPWDLLTV